MVGGCVLGRSRVGGPPGARGAGVGPRQKAAQATDGQKDAQLNKGCEEAGGGWGAGQRDNTAWGHGVWESEQTAGQGQLICSALNKRKQSRTQNSGELLLDFCVYCFTELFHPSDCQAGRTDTDPLCPPLRIAAS